MALTRGDEQYRPGDSVGNPLARKSPEEGSLSPIPEDFDRHLPVCRVHQGPTDLIVKTWGVLPEGLGEEELTVGNQGRSPHTDSLGCGDRELV